MADLNETLYFLLPPTAGLKHKNARLKVVKNADAVD